MLFEIRKARGMVMSDIAYQNKDITSKLFADRFKGKSLKVYGIDIPSVKQVLPTNIPQIKANELRIDNVFLLADDTVAIIDYESSYKKGNKHKYIQYINHVVEYYGKEWGKTFYVRMIVIYTADVERFQTNNILDVGCLKLEIESAYLAELDSEEISKRLERKVEEKIALTEEELMEFIILPLTYKGNDKKNESIKFAIDMAAMMEDEEIRIFLLSGLAVFADKVISSEHADEIRRLLGMTKVGRIFEEEKKNYAAEIVEEMVEEMVETMLRDGVSIEKVAKYANVSVEKVKKVYESILIKI